MDCPTEYHLPPPRDLTPHTVCIGADGFGIYSDPDCNDEPLDFVFGGIVTFINTDSVERTIQTVDVNGVPDGVLDITLAPSVSEDWQEDEGVPSIGVHTLVSDEDSVRMTIRSPAAIQLRTDVHNYGCCRTSIQLRTLLFYHGFQDFENNLYPQYKRKRTTTEFFDIVVERRTTGPNGDVDPGGTIPGIKRHYVERLRQPVRDVFGREEIIYEPDNGSYQWFSGTPPTELPGGPFRFEVDDSDPNNVYTYHYHAAPVGEPVLQSHNVRVQQMRWFYFVLLNGEPPEPDDCPSENPCDGGPAGVITEYIEAEYTAGDFCDYIDELVSADLIDRIDYPFTAGLSEYGYGTEVVAQDEEERDPYYDVLGISGAWPIEPWNEWYSVPGIGQPNVANHKLPEYNYIFADNDTSYSGLIPDNANSEPPVVNIGAFNPLFTDDQQLANQALQYQAKLDAVASSSEDGAGASIAVDYALVKRYWSAPYCRKMRQRKWEDVAVDPPYADELATCNEDLVGQPEKFTPCERADDPGLGDLRGLLHDWFTEMAEQLPPFKRRFLRELDQTCPDVNNPTSPCGCPPPPSP